MSTSWDLVCAEHNTRAGFDWNHGDEAIALLWRNRAQLVQLWVNREADEIFDFDEIRLNVNYEKITWEHVRFLREHGYHELHLVNEYRDRKAVDTMEKLPPHHCTTCTCEPR